MKIRVICVIRVIRDSDKQRTNNNYTIFIGTQRMNKEAIKSALTAMHTGDLLEKSKDLLATIGYHSERTQKLSGEVDEFIQKFEAENPDTRTEREFRNNAESVHLVSHFTYDEISDNIRQTPDLSANFLQDGEIDSFLFFAVELKDNNYSRTKYAEFTREINKRLSAPTVVLFRVANRLTIGFTDRRPNEIDPNLDVLGQVTLIKDIDLKGKDPHRAHVDILSELSLEHRLKWIDSNDEVPKNFDGLLEAWLEKLDTEELNKEFYRKLFAWYEWAVKEEDVRFPTDEKRVLKREEHVIRLITRLLFIWFMKEKGLVAEELFNKTQVQNLLTENDFDTGDSYYRVVLQNLFFATLNTGLKKREFSRENNSGHRNFSRYRYKSQMRDPNELLRFFKQTPFINGGLFDCLDSEEATREGGYRIDCFSDKQYHKLSIPNHLFFQEKTGLFSIFEDYKFTVEENTPIEQEVALDPELLGRVFENLLAAYNPETGATVRKQTGSYYTPRAIVDYMVEEALIATLSQKCQPTNGDAELWDEQLRYLFDYTQTFDDASEFFDDRETNEIVKAISELKILDPAVGSGAFPMGMLHKLTLALRRLDPDNTRWEELQKTLAGKRAKEAFNTQNQQKRDDELTEISDTFERYRDSDFGRKLYLIQNSIFGVDIQAIACQIAKLRFFISLAIEQEPDTTPENNYGIKPLPNLETRFIAANTLIGLKRQQTFINNTVRDLERQLQDNRERHFHTTTRQQKRICKDRDKTLRRQLAAELKRIGMPFNDAEKIAKWDIYDQNAIADWFDLKWMFGLTGGFDIVIGNPPYIDSEMMTRNQPELREIYKTIYQSAKGNWDLFIVFIERGIQLQKENGIISYIVPNTLIGAAYSKALRKMLLNHSFLEIRDYSKVDVFKESDVYPLVFVIRKTEQKNDVSMVVMSDFEKPSICNRISSELFYRDIFWDRFFVSENQLSVIVKCSSFPTVERFFEIGAAATVSEAYALKAYIREHSDVLSRRSFKKLINTGTIDRYKSLWSKQSTRYIKSSYNAPIVLDSDLRELSQRRFMQAESKKIIIGGMTKILECVYDEGKYIAGKSTVIMLESGKMSLKYALAVLNSTLVSFWYRIYFRSLSMAGGYLRMGANEIKTIPIPDVPSEQQGAIVGLVDQILDAKRANLETDISDLEKKIDKLVYALYDLTDDEVAIVEAAVE